MIGAIVLTFRQREGVKKQSYIKQISRERSEGVEVLEYTEKTEAELLNSITNKSSFLFLNPELKV